MTEATFVSDWTEQSAGNSAWSAVDEAAESTAVRLSFHSGLPLRKDRNGPISADSGYFRTVQLWIKRLIDIAGSLVLLLILAPALVAIALAIKATSKGPILFLQPREGLNGVAFTILKFRTMHIDECDQSGVAQTVVGDARVTPLGRLLRKLNLDELPQLLNVLRGDMSLIGPRPHAFRMLACGRRYDQHVPFYRARLAMKPGISGWAQCHGFRGPTEDPVAATARIEHDIAYIQNFSLIVDFKAAWRTLAREIRGGSGI